MSDDDINSPKKGNTDKRLKPNHVGDRNRTPRGSQHSSPTPSGLGTTKVLTFQYEITSDEDEAEQVPEKTEAEQRADYLDNLPEGTVFTDITGNEVIDQQSIDRGEVPVTKEEWEALNDKAPTQAEGPQISQSDFAKAFEQSRGQTQQFQQESDQDNELE